MLYSIPQFNTYMRQILETPNMQIDYVDRQTDREIQIM